MKNLESKLQKLGKVLTFSFLVLVIFFPRESRSQTFKDLKEYIFNKNRIAPTALMFASGYFDGTAEALAYRYDAFKKVWPNANDSFWDPMQSWENKWKNGDPNQGEKFPFSSTALVGLTDGYHLLRTGRNLTVVSALIFTIGGEKKKWHYYVVDFMLNYLLYSFGFSVSYELMY